MQSHSRLVAIKDSLIAISTLASVAATEHRAHAAITREHQDVIDSALGSVSHAQAAQECTLRRRGFSISNISPDVVVLGVPFAAVPGGQSRDVRVTVQASAQLGGLFLSFGGTYLDPQPHGPFVIDIGGRGGHAVIGLISGSPLERLAEVFNYYGKHHGHFARVSGTGVRIESHDLSSAAFVSVRMVEPVSILAPGAGIYRLDPRDSKRADPVSRIRFDAPLALHPITDHGQDIRIAVNGRPAIGRGASVIVLDWNLWAYMRLSTGKPAGLVNAQTLGSMIAFRIEPD